METPINSNRQLRVIIIGGGASGLLMAYKLQRNFDDISFVVYEKNQDIGGTWYENRYPGCACDNPAHTYTWSFYPNPNWSSLYAPSSEILEYFKNFRSHFNLGEKIQLSHQVIGSEWDETKGKWNVKIRETASEAGNIILHTCDVLINASGILNAWRWPVIPGLESFGGTLLHSAAWDTNFSVNGKRVGLIGNGSSGIQILPAILPEVGKCITFIREPTWVSVGGFQGFQPREYSNSEKENFSKDGKSLQAYRRWLEHNANRGFPLFLDNSAAQAMAREIFATSMRSKLKDAGLERTLIPNWAVGCRRLTPGIGYLESLKHAKTTVVYGEIQQINQSGCIMNDGQQYDVEALICATGFDTSFRPRFPVIARGSDLAADWKDEPRSYLGIAAAGYPNYFMFLGPNSPIGNGPVLVGIEAQANYFCQIITRIQQQAIKSIEVTREAVDDFVAFKDSYVRRTVWSQDCRSWYKNNSVDGKVTALWPGSTLHYIEALNGVRYDDFQVRYFNNRFDYLGNGMTRIEMTPDADLATYVRQIDDSPLSGSKFTFTRAGAELQEFNPLGGMGDEAKETQDYPAKL